MAWLVIIENLGSGVTEAEVKGILAPHSEVESVHLSKVESGTEPTCVASVQVESGKSGRDAIAALDGKDHAGRPLKVRVLKGDDTRGGVPRVMGRSARASVFGEKGGAASHKGIGKGGGRGL
jgi:hypothetical protein